LREFDFTEVMRDTMSLAVPPKHPFAKLKTVKLEEVVREPLIAYSRKDYPEAYKMLVTFFAGLKMKPRIIEEHDSVNSLIAAVEAGVGIAIVTDSLKCTAGWRLKFVPFSPALPPIIIGAFWPKKKLSPAGEKFVECAKQISKETAD
jgi:DNA-binding transcriptional LysR family regulator